MSGEILSADELEPARQFVGFVKRNADKQGVQRNSAADLIERLLASHEALRDRLAGAEWKHDAMQGERDGLRARLAEVEQALQGGAQWVTNCKNCNAMPSGAPNVRSLMRPPSTICAAVWLRSNRHSAICWTHRSGLVQRNVGGSVTATPLTLIC